MVGSETAAWYLCLIIQASFQNVKAVRTKVHLPRKWTRTASLPSEKKEHSNFNHLLWISPRYTQNVEQGNRLRHRRKRHQYQLKECCLWLRWGSSLSHITITHPRAIASHLSYQIHSELCWNYIACSRIRRCTPRICPWLLWKYVHCHHYYSPTKDKPP